MTGNIQVNNSNSEQKLSLQRQINTKESQKSDLEEKRTAQAHKIQKYEDVLNNLWREEDEFVVRKRNFGNIEPNGQEWNGTVGKTKGLYIRPFRKAGFQYICKNSNTRRRKSSSRATIKFYEWRNK